MASPLRYAAALLLLLLPAPAAAEPTDSAGYIVTLNDSSASSDLAARWSGKIRHRYTHALHGFSATMSAREAAALARDPRVVRVEPDGISRIGETQNNAPWNLDRIDQRNLPLSTTYTYTGTGSGINVYILDTGIRTTHQNFGGRAKHGYDFIDNDTDASDCNGHGTHVAGTVGGSTYGVAKGVTLHAVRVLGCGGTGPNSGVIAAIDWVTTNAVKPAIVNMSLSDVTTPSIDDAVNRSIASGITYVVAAGNYSSSACDRSPARVPAAITVANSTRTDARYSDSNFGSCVDLFGPGTDVVSAGYTSDTGTATKSGTSMAAPAVAGAAAIYLAANPNSTPAQIATAIIGCTTPNVISGAGSGTPNKLLFLPCGATTPGDVYENVEDTQIPDWSTVDSTINISGRTGNAPATLKVAVEVKHPYRGDIALSLIAPDGTAYPLKSALMSDLADDISATYTVDASSEAANGAWRLRVRDTCGFDTGFLDRWSLTF